MQGCVALRNWRVQFTTTLACNVLAFALGDQLVANKPPSVDEVRPKVVIRAKEFFVPEHCPKDASGKLEYDKNLIKDLDTKTTGVLRNMCKHNPPFAQPTYKDKKADLIYKCVFCDFICSTRVCTSYMYICIYIYDITSPSFLEPHFVSNCNSRFGPDGAQLTQVAWNRPGGTMP